jgi:hypothetical protein
VIEVSRVKRRRMRAKTAGSAGAMRRSLSPSLLTAGSTPIALLLANDHELTDMLLQTPLLSVLAFGLPALTLADSLGSRHPAKSTLRPLPSLREQDALERRWVAHTETFVTEALKKYEIDAYIIDQREYAEDTTFRALTSSAGVFSARRRTLWLFHTSPALPSPLKWVDNTPALWAALNDSLTTIDPNRIAVNIDEAIAFSDGLHTGEGQALRTGLGEHWSSKLTSERMLGVEVVSRRSGGEEQLKYYRMMQVRRPRLRAWRSTD